MTFNYKQPKKMIVQNSFLSEIFDRYITSFKYTCTLCLVIPLYNKFSLKQLENCKIPRRRAL